MEGLVEKLMKVFFFPRPWMCASSEIGSRPSTNRSIRSAPLFSLTLRAPWKGSWMRQSCKKSWMSQFYRSWKNVGSVHTFPTNATQNTPWTGLPMLPLRSFVNTLKPTKHFQRSSFPSASLSSPLTVRGHRLEQSLCLGTCQVNPHTPDMIPAKRLEHMLGCTCISNAQGKLPTLHCTSH